MSRALIGVSVEGVSELETGSVDGREAELEPGVQGSSRDHFLTVGDDGSAFRTEHESPEEGRGRDEARPVHALRKLFHEVLKTQMKYSLL